MKDEKLVPITLLEAEQLMGTFDDDNPEFPGLGMLRATNGDATYGYGLSLDNPRTRFFKTEGEHPIVVIRVPEGASARARHGTEFECDGLGWGDDTVYVPGTHQFEQHVKEMGAIMPMRRMRSFLDSLPIDVKLKAEPTLSVGLHCVQARVHDPQVEANMRARGEDELRIAIHSNPFITLSVGDEKGGIAPVVVGPPWMVDEERGMMGASAFLEDIARSIMTRAARR